MNLERKGKNFQFLRCVSQLFNVHAVLTTQLGKLTPAY